MMNIQSQLVATIFTKQQYLSFSNQDTSIPHIAMVGRSNVGKSSLINALLGRTALARVSSTPGKTRSINIYSIASPSCFLVDLPGYGYAQCSKKEQKSWAGLIEYYLQMRSGYHHSYIVLLVDSRRIPQQSDITLLEYISELGLPLIPVLTKIDKVTQKEKHKTIKAWEEYSMATFLQTSSTHKKGISNLWDYLQERISDI